MVRVRVEVKGEDVGAGVEGVTVVPVWSLGAGKGHGRSG